MKRIFLVLALALMLIFGVWGQAYATQTSGGSEGDDHPWGGSNSGEQPQYRYESSTIVYSAPTGIFPIDVILNDHIFLDEILNIIIRDAEAEDVYLESEAVTSRVSTLKKRLR